MRGEIDPYWGSGTVEKKTNPLIKISGTDRALDAAKRLSRVKMWVIEKDSKVGTFLTDLISSRTELRGHLLELASGVYFGGSITHRFGDVMTKHVSRPNTRGNIFTCIFLSSDKMGKYSKGLDNYTMHYQGAFLLGQTLISYEEYFSGRLRERPITYHQHISCIKCCVELVEPRLTSEVTPPKIRIDKTCKILYSNISDISDRIDLGSMTGIPLDNPNQGDPTLGHKALCAMSYVILGCLLKESSPLVMGKGSKGNEFRTSTTITLGSVMALGCLNIIEKFSAI